MFIVYATHLLSPIAVVHEHTHACWFEGDHYLAWSVSMLCVAQMDSGIMPHIQNAGYVHVTSVSVYLK